MRSKSKEVEMHSDDNDLPVDDGPTEIPIRPERNPAEIERQVLGVSSTSSVEELCEVICASDWLVARARDIQRLVNEIAIAWIEHNQEFNIGDVRYSVGYPMSIRCINVPQTGHAVLEATGGDFDQFLLVLVAQPFKHASVREVIGQTMHNQLFRAFRTARLNGVPQRTLKRVDTRFAKPS